MVAEQGFEPGHSLREGQLNGSTGAASAVQREYAACMKTFTAVVERDTDTGLFVGWVPGFPGAHTQAETLDELRANLREVVETLLEDGSPELKSEFVGTQTVEVA